MWASQQPGGVNSTADASRHRADGGRYNIQRLRRAQKYIQQLKADQAVAAHRESHYENRYLNLAEAPSEQEAPGVREALLQGFSIPALFAQDHLRTHCHRSLPKLWALVSASGSGSAFHVDPFNTSAWNSLLQGSKRWALYPPAVRQPAGLEAVAEAPPGHDFDYWDNTLNHAGWWGVTSPYKKELAPLKYFTELLPQVPEGQAPLQCMLRAGETIFVPSGWWHLVLNTEETVAVTGNFMDDANALNVLGELAKRPRNGEAVQACYDQLEAAQDIPQVGTPQSDLVPEVGDKLEEDADDLEDESEGGYML